MGFEGIIAFLYFLSFACPALTISCPPPEDIVPCECSEAIDELRLYCDNVDISLDDLKRIMQALQKTGSKFDIVLYRVKLGTIPSDFFQGFNINLLEFSTCEIDFPMGEGERPFRGLENVLKFLFITSCFHGENSLTRIDLSHLRHLTNLDISQNAIQEIGDDWQRNVPTQLRDLTFEGNGITYLGTRAFDNLPYLERFILFSNRFGEAHRSFLPNPASQLYELDLTDNDLSSFPEDFFTGMPALRELCLSDNRFTTIPERTFLVVWQQLEEFDIQDNPLHCDDSSIEWMCRVRTSATIAGTCQSPPERAGMDLAELIQIRRNELQGLDNDGTILYSPSDCIE